MVWYAGSHFAMCDQVRGVHVLDFAAVPEEAPD